MKISIVIPVYNVGELLHKSVDSVLSQNQNDCEIIIVDDGSTDGSGAMCDEYLIHPCVKVIHKKNGGLSSARNAGIDVAEGGYLMFLDSDDYLRPGSVDLLSRLVDEYDKPDFIQFSYDEVSDYSDNNPASGPANLFELTERRLIFEQKFKLGGIGASACTKLIRKDVFNRLRFKDGIIHEDELFTTHLINQAARAVYISNPLYMYVQRPGSIITSKFSPKRLDIIPVLEEQIEVLLSNGFVDLADIVKSNLFTALCVMYVEARRYEISECVRIIQKKTKEILPDVKIKDGTIGIIAHGMKLHLPMLQTYYIFKKWESLKTQ